MAKFYITTPIYYSNAEPHIGSAYPTIAADVLARFHRLKGDEVFFLTGVDEHGAKMADAAAEKGMDPQLFADLMSAKFESCWDELDISNDDFLRTTSDRHERGAIEFLTRLKEADAVYKGVYSGYYCKGCEAFVTEKDLENGCCPVHKTPAELIEENNYFFKLKEYLPAVKKAIDSGEIEVFPANKKKEVLGLFKQDLQDFSISRSSLKWGIAIPWDKEQVTYVWTEALMNYITALGFGSADGFRMDKFWPADVHIVGKDIIKFHCIFWPAMLIAAGLKPPKAVFAHGFFTVDGQKMGKSLGNVIDPLNLIREFGTDATRYLLLSQFPFGQDGDIKAAQFAIQFNSDLANGIGNYASRVTAMAEKYLGGIVPNRSSELKDKVAAVWKEYQEALIDFQIDGAISAIKKINDIGDGYVEENKPWELAKTDPERLNEVMYGLLELLRHLALMLWPVMPSTSEKIFASLGQSDFSSKKIEELQVWALLEPGSKVNKSEALFPRIQ